MEAFLIDQEKTCKNKRDRFFQIGPEKRARRKMERVSDLSEKTRQKRRARINVTGFFRSDQKNVQEEKWNVVLTFQKKRVR